MIEPYYQTELGKLYCGDCLEIMKEIPDGSVDYCIVDFSYNISNNKNTLIKRGNNFK